MTLDDVIDALKHTDGPIVEEMVARLLRVRAALTDLSTSVHYSAKDTTGEASTRRVQCIAANALRGDELELERP